MSAGKYRTIVADPPWPIRWSGGATWRVNGRGERHLNKQFKRELGYKTLSIEEICALPVLDLAEDDAHLFLWIPDEFLVRGDGDRVARAWGFTPGRLLIWEKSGYGLGRFPRPQHEALVVAKRGSLPFRVANAGSVQHWRFEYSKGHRIHSRKPSAALDLIEQASPGPYLELFARRQRMGWDTWGDECFQDIAIHGLRPKEREGSDDAR